MLTYNGICHMEEAFSLSQFTLHWPDELMTYGVYGMWFPDVNIVNEHIWQRRIGQEYSGPQTLVHFIDGSLNAHGYPTSS